MVVKKAAKKVEKLAARLAERTEELSVGVKVDSLADQRVALKVY
jgi:hypothetical protein